MPKGKKNDHFWVWLPELGWNYQYCDLCKKVENIHSEKRMTYKQALAEIEESKKERGLKLMRENVYEYKNTGFFVEFNANQRWIIYRDYLSRSEFPDFQEWEIAIDYIDEKIN